MTQADSASAKYADFRFGSFVPAIALHASTRLSIVVPAEMSIATGHTAYEQFSITCYSSTCASVTGVTSSTSPIPFDNVLAAFNSPYFESTQALDFSVVGTWAVPAFGTNFDLKLKGDLLISSTYYDCFEFTFNTLSTAENTKTMSFSPLSPESGATTTLVMTYILSR